MSRRHIGPLAAIGVAALGLAASAAPARADLEDVGREIKSEMEASQGELSRLQQQIAEQRRSMAQRLNAAQNSVADLREQAAAAVRASDEQTLSLNQLQQRLDAWQEQSTFQTRLVSGFADQVGRASDQAPGAVDLETGLELVAGFVGRHRNLTPEWQQHDVIMPDGQIESSAVLALGPVQWFWRDAAGVGGLLDPDSERPRAALVFSGGENDGLGRLHDTGRGVVTFDPTLSRALTLAEEHETLIEHLHKGGIWVYPILAFAVFATTIAVIKAVALWRLPELVPALATQVEQALAEGGGKIESFKSRLAGAQAELVEISLAARNAGQRDDRLFASLLEYRHQLDRWLGAIAVTASVSPLLGLLGTVSGMIATFRLMTLFGAGDPSSVSAGISEALVTTELGLIVAIPALLAHALMSRKVRSYFGQLESNAIQLSQIEYGEGR